MAGGEWQQANLHSWMHPGGAVGAKEPVPGQGVTAWQGVRVLLWVPGVMGACSEGACGALWNWRSPKALERELQISPLERGKAMLIVRFLVCIQDLHKCCRILVCCGFTAPVSLRAGEEQTPSSLH